MKQKEKYLRKITDSRIVPFFFQTPIGSKLRKKKRREAEFLKPP